MRKNGRGMMVMSEKHPECPLYNPSNCKEYYNPKLCAFVRRDKLCLKKKKPLQRHRQSLGEDLESSAITIGWIRSGVSGEVGE
jgi:hypothetical protein